MQEFIEQAAAKFGISTEQAESATGGLLGLIKSQASDEDANELLDGLPGARELNDRTENFELGGEEESEGLLGKAMDAVGGLMGGKAEGAMGALSGLQKSGLKLGDTDDFLGMLGGFIKDKMGGGILQKIIGQVPALKGLVGG